MFLSSELTKDAFHFNTKVPCFFNSLSPDILTEIPTSGDLKSGDCLFFTTPPPRNFKETAPPPPRKIDPAPNVNDLGHYMTSYMKN